MLPKTQPLCISTKWKLGDRVLGEAEKNNFIALPGKGGHCRLLPQKKKKSVFWNPGGFGEDFYSNGSRMRVLKRIGLCKEPEFL